MRARLHVRGGRAGFFREGTHDLCDAGATRQVLPETLAIVEHVLRLLRSGADLHGEVEVAENLDATERVVHLDLREHAGIDTLKRSHQEAGLAGLTGMTERGPAPSLEPLTLSGDPFVRDTLTIAGKTVRLRRHVLAFFQGNRYLLHDLVSHVVGLIPERSRVLDLYAGCGLFAVSAAIVRDATVTAVEGDRTTARDLVENCRAAGGRITPIGQSVETFARSRPPAPDVVIVDPPRTGMSREALESTITLGAPTAIYVSCDVATLARDARRMLDRGYAIRRLDAFDLFPNTPHVETVVLFERG
jgi:23S rRNA (uracil1939-C5)-methyltransferase